MNAKHLIIGIATLSLLGVFLYVIDDDKMTNIHASSVEEFNQFNRKYKKEYLSLSERNYRLQIFHSNLLHIREHNAKNLTWTLGVNKFTDLTFEEFSQAYLRQNTKKISLFDGPMPQIGEKNWHKEGKVTPVKDQGQCEDCYAFGALSSFESGLALKFNKHIIVSESEIVDCSGAQGNHGCKGGEMDQTFNYILAESINVIEDYPYVPKDNKCSAKKDKPRYKMIRYHHINPVNMQGLIKAIKKRPVSVCFEVRKDFHSYSSGIYSGESDCGKSANHCILAYGYGTDPKTKLEFTHMKNSWGSDWGESGHFRMKIVGGSGTCGVANKDAIYPIMS